VPQPRLNERQYYLCWRHRIVLNEAN
jgi:hypothetical protein